MSIIDKYQIVLTEVLSKFCLYCINIFLPTDGMVEKCNFLTVRRSIIVGIYFLSHEKINLDAEAKKTFEN